MTRSDFGESAPPVRVKLRGVELDRLACDRARQSRDARFDGRFFIGVTSTRIYCRPICPARAPKDEHVRYFATAAAAEAAGFRPCMRCRPEASPGTPAWSGTSGIVSRALRLIGEGALDDAGVERLADRVGVTGRHLRRLFVRHLGASPLDVAQTRRLHFAKKLLDETTLAMRDVAVAAGFGSVRRFNSQIRGMYARTPSQLRRLARADRVSGPDRYRFRLAFRPPYDWDAVLKFLAARATPGVEVVNCGHYRRTITFGGAHGEIDVSRCDRDAALRLDVRIPDPRALLIIVDRVRRMFDLAADPELITAQLGGDPLLRGPLQRHPGIRTPGAWNDFELAVRAILGQQISVQAATTIAGRLAAAWGATVGEGAAPNRLFPTPAQLRDAPLERIGVISSRAETIRTLARRVADGAIVLNDVDPAATVQTLTKIPGIGRWTAEYIAMRGLGEPDAFPSSDLVLRRLAGGCTARELERRSEPWRPWRAYAVMLLWQEATDQRSTISGRVHESVSRPNPERRRSVRSGSRARRHQELYDDRRSSG